MIEREPFDHERRPIDVIREETARAAFELLESRDLHTVHHALRMLAKFPSEHEEATRLADVAWAVHCERLESAPRLWDR